MKNYLVAVLFVLTVFLLPGDMLAADTCCVKKPCACAKNSCCLQGKCACQGECFVGGDCKCAQMKCGAKCNC